MSGSISAVATTTGPFRVSNGQVLDPAGKVFTPRGIAISPAQMGDANQVLADFPGLNFIRLTAFDYGSPDTYAAFIDTMTSHGIVVEFEDHTSSDGANGGGSRGIAYTGQLLTDELNWYSSIARAYASNPYVWFGTDNEPPTVGLSTWEQQTYNAIRNTGNPNPIMMELPGGGYPDGQSLEAYGMDPSVYLPMSNVLVDTHLYGWSSNFIPDEQAVTSALAALVRGGQSMTTIDGHVPVIIGEYGIATEGEAADANAAQVLQVAQHSTLVIGAVAFTWSGPGMDTLSDGQGHLTSYGQQVAQWIASPSQPVASSGPVSTGAMVSQSNISTFATSSSDMLLIGGSNGSAAASAGMDDGGNIYVVPAMGNGPLTLADDILNTGGTLDLTTALAATDWNGARSTLPDYLTVTDTPAGADISLTATSRGAGMVIATIPGATDLSVDSLLARSIT